MERDPGDASDADRHEAVAHLEPAGSRSTAGSQAQALHVALSDQRVRTEVGMAQGRHRRNPLIPRGTDRCRTCIGGGSRPP